MHVTIFLLNFFKIRICVIKNCHKCEIRICDIRIFVIRICDIRIFVIRIFAG